MDAAVAGFDLALGIAPVVGGALDVALVVAKCALVGSRIDLAGNGNRLGEPAGNRTIGRLSAGCLVGCARGGDRSGDRYACQNDAWRAVSF